MRYKSWIIAAGIGLWLYFLLPQTAVFFFELYHFTGIGFVYWGYSGFKAASYYFGTWEYQAAACVAVVVLVGGIGQLVGALRGPERAA